MPSDLTDQNLEFLDWDERAEAVHQATTVHGIDDGPEWPEGRWANEVQAPVPAPDWMWIVDVMFVAFCGVGCGIRRLFQHVSNEPGPTTLLGTVAVDFWLTMCFYLVLLIILRGCS